MTGTRHPDLPEWAQRNGKAEVVSSIGHSSMPPVQVWITRVTPSGQVVTNYKTETRFTLASLAVDGDAKVFRKRVSNGTVLTLRQVTKL